MAGGAELDRARGLRPLRKQNFTQIFEGHFQINYSVSVRDGFMLVCLMICIWHVNHVPDPVLRRQPCRS